MSVFFDILTGVKQELISVLQPFNIDVVIKRNAVWQDGDNLPLCVVSAKDEEELEEQYMSMLENGANTSWAYPVCITLFYPNNMEQNMELDAQLYLQVREDIRNALFKTSVSGVSSVWDVKISGTKPFELIDQKCTYSTYEWVVKYKSLEERLPCV